MTKKAEPMPTLPGLNHNQPPSDILPVYDEVREKIEKLREEDKGKTFNYEDRKENDAARSYVAGIRKYRAEVERVRKAAKDESLRYGKKVDDDAKAVVKPVDEIIERHDSELKAIADREIKRKEEIQNRISTIKAFGQSLVGFSSKDIQARIDKLPDTLSEEKYQEYKAVADEALVETREALANALELAKKQEERDSELALLRAQQVEAEEKEKLRIAHEREQEAIRAAAALAVEKERAAAAAREQELKDRLAAAEREKADAELREQTRLENERLKIERDAAAEIQRKLDEEKRIADERQEAIDFERKRAEAEKAETERLEALAAKNEAERQADLKHREAIENEALAAIESLNITAERAALLLDSIKAGNIPHISISYAKGK